MSGNQIGFSTCDETDLHKLKFLDNLFDAGSDVNCITPPSLDHKSSIKEIKEIFGFKICIGTLLFFFLLCYVFSLKFLIVIPTMFITLNLYVVLTLGVDFYIHWLKTLTKYVKLKFKEEMVISEYTLMEI